MQASLFLLIILAPYCFSLHVLLRHAAAFSASLLLSLDTSPALEQVARVKYSLAGVIENINTGSDSSKIVAQVKSLVNNYKLKNNLAAALEGVPANNRAEAKDHSARALEDLVQIYEYFADDIDNMSGTTRPPREVLQFASKAVEAADAELDALFRLFPQPDISEITTKIQQEFVPAASDVQKQ